MHAFPIDSLSWHLLTDALQRHYLVDWKVYYCCAILYLPACTDMLQKLAILSVDERQARMFRCISLLDKIRREVANSEIWNTAILCLMNNPKYVDV